jgi:BatD DUF11 like domain
VIALLALGLLAQQQATPDVMLGVDRDRVAAGDAMTLTIRVTSTRADPIRVDLPSLGGFELESRSERSDVSAGAPGGRTTTIQLKLRATTPGEWRLGPVNVRQGSAFAQGDPITVTISGTAPGPATAALSPRLARMLQRAPPPDALGLAGISVALSDDSVAVGEQVDVVTIAWFERGLRQQLRRAPTVESPHIEGVWSYPQPVPGGIAATRQVGGKWYDLFVLHQIVFPLTMGRVPVSGARLQYSVPLAYQFFSQEEAYKLESSATSFEATALPAEGRDPTFAGATGRRLTVRQTIVPGTGRQGEAFNADIEVSGTGNVALWPQPDLQWPPAFRVYPQAAEEQLTMSDGWLGGTKTFHFLLVADSAGALGLPPIRYSYFDFGDQRYHQVEGAAALVVVAPRGSAVASRAEPPPIRLSARRPVALALRQALPDAAWWLLALAPALVVVWQRAPRRRRALPAREVNDNPMAVAEHRIRDRIRRGGLLAEEEAGLRALALRLQEARFGERAQEGQAALLRAVDAALAQSAPRPRPGAGRWRQRTGVAGALLLAAASWSNAQTQPEQLYDAGAYRASLEGFRQRALADPEVPTHWFNLGDAAYRSGDDAIALVAWVRAARLAPRDPGIRRALRLVAPADPAAQNSLWIAPFTPSELWLLGLVAWLSGWIGVIWSRELRGRWAVLLAGGALLVLVSIGLDRWYHAPVAVVAVNDQLRLSPHELAPATGEIARLQTVRLEAVRGRWAQVDAGAGQRGWIRQESVQPVAGTLLP